MHFLMILMMFLHKNKQRAPALQNNMQLLLHHDDWLISEHEDIPASLNSYAIWRLCIGILEIKKIVHFQI